jgi:hypothetical protein
VKPPKVKKIFIDLDDVLNKCTMHILHILGTKVTSDLSEDFFDPGWGYDIVKAANCLTETPGVRYTRKTLWDNIGRNNWATIPYSDEFGMLVTKTASIVGKGGISILTKPLVDDPECSAGKHEWIRSRCPQWLRGKWFLGSPKHQCASPVSLLIDDSEKQVGEFKAKGGQAILVPRPWNSLHGYNAYEYLERALRRVRSGLDVSDPAAIAFGMQRRIAE